jgi:predicted phosphoribosyltransferase
MLFVDRADAGRQLARRLLYLRGTDAVVVALPRGGVPVAAEVARELRAPLDVIVVRKLGVPFQPECGFGAIGEGGATVIDDRVVRQARLTRQAIVAEAIASLRHDADEVICLHTPAPLVAIGDWYQDFSQVADAEVAGLLGPAVTCPESRDAAPDPTEVTMDAGGVLLPGSLVIPPDAGGLVVFVHERDLRPAGAGPTALPL